MNHKAIVVVLMSYMNMLSSDIGHSAEATKASAAQRILLKRPGTNYSDAESLRERLTSWNFQCDPQDHQQSFVCKGKVESYPEPIRIYIPKSYKKNSKRLAIHFHGNNSTSTSRDNSVHFSDNRADFNRWLQESDSDNLLILPDSLGWTKTYDTHFPSSNPAAAASNFDKFIDSIEEATGSEIHTISLSAHSGAYRTVGALSLAESTRLSQIDAVGLFDAVYGRASQLSNWISKLKARGGLFQVVFVENGTTLNSGPGDQRELNSILQRQGVVPREYKSGQPTASLSLQYTKSSHMDVLKEQRYTDFLRSIKTLRERR
jgi:hypothetical protein